MKTQMLNTKQKKQRTDSIVESLFNDNLMKNHYKIFSTAGLIIKHDTMLHFAF